MNDVSASARDVMIDEILSLRSDLARARLEAFELSRQRDRLRANLAEATQADRGRALGNALRRVSQLSGRVSEYAATHRRLEFRLKRAEALAQELGAR